MTEPLLVEDLRALVTMNDAGEELRDAYLFVRDGVVAALGTGPAPEGLRAEAGHTFDGRGRVALPGLVNAHDHLYQSITRAYPSAQDKGLFDWLRALYPLWRRLTPEEIGLASKVSMAELLLSGCTTTVDHTYVSPDPGASRALLHETVRGGEELGVRLYLAVGGATLGESRGGIQPDASVPKEQMLLDLYSWAAGELGGGDRVKVAVGPSSLFAVGADFMSEAAALAADLGVPRHAHVAESLDEREFAKALYGHVPISLLEKHGWLEGDVWLAHAVHVDEEEVQRFARAGVGVAHCPCSNMRLGSGIAPLRAYLDAGVAVGLGADGSASNDGGHMLGEARQALLLARAVGGAGALTAREAQRLATRGGAEALGRDDLGRIEVGKKADVAIYALDDIALHGTESDPVAGLVLSWPPRAETVIADGRVVVEEGRVTGLDLDGLLRAHRRASLDLLGATVP